MRLRAGVTCATMTCAGVLSAGGLVSCVGDNNAAPTTDASVIDATQPDTSVPPSADSGTDAGANAADAADAAPIVDASPGIDAADSAVGCVPTGNAFTPPAYVHAQAQTFDCPNDSQDLALAQACTGDASTFAACSTFATTGMADDAGIPTACATCLLTPEVPDDAGTYGPAVVGPVTAPNVAGCVELADPSDAGLACAVAVQAAAKCAEFECKPNCPVTDTPSRAAFFACVQVAATSTACSAYTLAANACLAMEADGGPSSIDTWCVGAPDPVTQFEDIARFFCTS